MAGASTFGYATPLPATRLRRLFALMADDLKEALGSADLVVVGKRMSDPAYHLAGNVRSVDLYRL